MKLGILSDIHQQPPDAPGGGWFSPYPFHTVGDRLERSLAFLRDQEVDRVAVLGDLSNLGDVPSIRTVIEIVAASGIPAWVIPGNHDLMLDPGNFEQALREASAPTVSSPVDTNPTWNGWKVGAPAITRVQGHRYRLSADPDTDAWGDDPVVILSHFPIVGFGGDAATAGLKYAGDYIGAEEFTARLTARPAPVVATHGHLHIRNALASGSVLQASCGSQVDALYEVTVVDFGGWPDGHIAWTATPIDPEYPGVSPALSAREQGWTWDGSKWTRRES
ncbi:MAG TPA: metallophosphoesterase [Thermomicrobiales bacterium]|nr:metallophosphoesterase [Thermomicrobiales bacterium]